MKSMQATNTECAIWDRLFRPAGRTLSVPAARSILALEFSNADTERMHELASKARDGLFTVAEDAEIKSYERAGNVLALWKSKARQRLKKVPPADGARNGRGNGSRS